MKKIIKEAIVANTIKALNGDMKEDIMNVEKINTKKEEKMIKGMFQIKLDEKSQDILKKNTIHNNVFCEHITLGFGCYNNDATWSPMVGNDVDINGYLMVRNYKGQCLRVFLPEEIESNMEGRMPHITISCADGVKPVYSNDLMKLEDALHDNWRLDLKGTIVFKGWNTPKPKKEDINMNKKKVNTKTNTKKEVVMRNTSATLNKFIEMVNEEGSVIKVCDEMTIVTVDGRTSRVYTDALTNHISIREEIRANDALAYTQFVKGRSEARKERVIVDSKVSTRNGEDFGKIRFCRDCGLQVMETVDSDVSVCPKCGERKEYDKDEYTYCMDDEVVYDFNDPDGIQRDNLKRYVMIQPDFMDGHKWANKAYLKKDKSTGDWFRCTVDISDMCDDDIAKYTRKDGSIMSNREAFAAIKAEWIDGEELSLNMDFGKDDDCSVMRDVSPMEHQKMLDYSTRMTELTDRKVVGLRSGFRQNLLRNPKIAKARLEALRPLVSKEETERLEYLLEDTESVYEYIFRSKIRTALHNGIIDMRWVNSNKYSLKGKMWKYTSSKNKAYWEVIKSRTNPEAIRVFNLTPEGNKCKYTNCATCSCTLTCNRESTSTDRKMTDQQVKDAHDFGQTDYSPEYPDVY